MNSCLQLSTIQMTCHRTHDPLAAGSQAGPECRQLAWMVALSPSSRMISPISLSAPTRMSSYMAAPAMLSATTTGPDTLRTYLQVQWAA